MKDYEIKPINSMKSQVIHPLAGTVFVGRKSLCESFVMQQRAKAAEKANQ